MIAINLLPGDRKNRIKRKKIFWSMFWQEVMFVFVFIFFAVILYSVNLMLDLKTETVDQSTKNETDGSDFKEIREYENKFSRTNEKVSNLVKIEKNHFFWSSLLEKISKQDLEGITVKELSSRDFNILIRGKADTREHLISFKEELGRDSCFSEIDVPLSNLVLKTDVDFLINLKIDEKCLRNNQ